MEFEEFEKHLKQIYAIDSICLAFKKLSKPVLIYTGRGFTDGFHLGHFSQLRIIKKLLQLPLVNLFYMISNDQKYLQTQDTFNEPNVNLAISFLKSYFKNESKTKFFVNTQEILELYPSILFFAKFLKHKTVSRLFGILNQNVNLVRHFYMPIQCAPCHYFAKTYHVIVLLSMDQKPYFEKVNDILETHGYPTVSFIFTKPVPNLQLTSKMSARARKSAIFLDDPEIFNKVKSAKSGFDKNNQFIDTNDFCYLTGRLLDLSLPYIKYSKKQISSFEFKKLFYSAIVDVINTLQ